MSGPADANPQTIEKMREAWGYSHYEAGKAPSTEGTRKDTQHIQDTLADLRAAVFPDHP